MRNAFFIGLAVFATAMIGDRTASAQQAKYFADVTNSSCLGSSACTFNFPAVTFSNPNGNLTVTKVSCRIVVTNVGPYAPDITYAILGKSANPSKVEFLSHSEFLIGSSNQITYYQAVIDANTMFFVSVGASPVITINVGTLIGSMLSSTDQPTCSVSGFLQ